MYDNILKALGSSNEPQKLTYEEQAQNYSLFSDLMKKGVRLQDLIDKANAPKDPGFDENLFRIMEDAVADDPGVRESRKSLNSVRNIIIGQLCMGDCRYQDAYKDYKDNVVKAYTEKKDSDGVKEDNPSEGGKTR